MLKNTITALCLLLIIATQAQAQSPHGCQSQATSRALDVLKFHVGADASNPSLDPKVSVLPSVKSLKGSGSFDVLEFWGFVYKARYRIRMLYARTADTCLEMGHEILEESDPF